MSQNDTQETVVSKFVSPVSDASDVVKNPTSYGLEWYADEIRKGGTLLSKDAPRIKVTNLNAFVEWFGTDLVLSCVNGTSLDVKIESVVRDIYDRNATAKVEDVRLAVVNRVLLGNRTRTVTTKTVTVEKPVYIAMDGTKFDSEIESKQHNLMLMVENGVSIAQAKAMLGISE